MHNAEFPETAPRSPGILGTAHHRPSRSPEEKLGGGVGETQALPGELEAVRDFCHIPPADGAFYILLKVETSLDSLRLAERLIREHGVAAMPGVAFGLGQGCYLRIAYGALDETTAAEGLRRLVVGLKSIL